MLALSLFYNDRTGVERGKVNGVNTYFYVV